VSITFSLVNSLSVEVTLFTGLFIDRITSIVMKAQIVPGSCLSRQTDIRDDTKTVELYSIQFVALIEHRIASIIVISAVLCIAGTISIEAQTYASNE